MASKTFKKYFSADFAGINGETSAIEEEGTEFNRAVNYEYSVGNSLRGRVGTQIIGSANGFFGMFPYSYTRTQDQYDLKYQVGSGVYPNQVCTLSTTKTSADGASINKLIAIDKQMYVLDEMVIPITVSAGSVSGPNYPFSWWTYVSGSSIFLKIVDNAANVILDISLGDGLTTPTTIYDVLGTINGTVTPTATLAVNRGTRGVCPPFAIAVGGAPTVVGIVTYGTRYQIAVNAGHTFYPGDLITFNTPSPNSIDTGVVISRAAGTIDFVGAGNGVFANAQLGYMGQLAAGLKITTAQSVASGAINLNFPYFRNIPEGGCSPVFEYGKPFLDGKTAFDSKTTNSFYAPPSATSANGCLYVAASGGSSLAATGTVFTGYSNNLVKTDGGTVSKTGLGVNVALTVTAPGAGALTGTYKYKAFLRRIDAQGNIVEGQLGSIKTITYAAQYGAITVDAGFQNQGLGWLTRAAHKYTTETPATSAVAFYVDDNSAAPGRNAFIQPGDPICYLDNTAQKTGLWLFAFGVDVLGTLHRTVCTEYDGLSTPSSIRIASAGLPIPDNTPISTGVTVVVLRTANGGNTYYELAEIPYTGISTLSFFDNVTDTVLTAGIQFTEPVLGKEHNAPPLCSLVCQHQGGLVVARGFNSPNTVAFSSADGIEYFPTASNSFDIPSTQSGFITAIASDTNDRLAVFKDRAYYDVVGDLDNGAFSINVKNEGDYGITSQASLVRVLDGLIGLSRNGFVTINNGVLSPAPFPGVNARILNQGFDYAWATAVNDSYNRQYVCAIPDVSADPVIYVIDYSRTTKNPATFERDYNFQMDPTGGMVSLDGDFYHLSMTNPLAVFRRLERFNGNSPTGNNGDSFIDNTVAINYILETNAINLGEPALLKTPIRLRTWSLPNDYVNEGWIPFSALIETAPSPIASYIGGSTPGATTSTITFSAATDIFKDIKLVNVKTHFYLVRLTTNAVRTAPFITGYEIMFVENYEKEDFIK